MSEEQAPFRGAPAEPRAVADADLHQRAQALFDRFKAFPEAGRQGSFFLVREDAFLAFLDMRQLLEREILPALAKLPKRGE